MYDRVSDEVVTITMDVPIVGRSILEFRFPPDSLYPHELPIFFFKNDKISPKIRRKIMEKMVEECKESLLGSAMIYSLTVWLTSNVAAIDMNEPIYSALLIREKEKEREKEKPKEEETGVKEKPAEANRIDPKKLNRRIMQLSPKEKEEISKKMYQEAQAKQSSEGYQRLKKVREKLPVYATRERFLQTIANNQVVVLTGETGSGKTTQV